MGASRRGVKSLVPATIRRQAPRSEPTAQASMPRAERASDAEEVLSQRGDVENIPQLRVLIRNLGQVRSPCYLCEVIAQPLRARTLWPALLSRRLRRWQSPDPDAAVNAFRYGARASDHGGARPRKSEPVAPYLARFRARFSAQSEECQDSQENNHKPDDR